MSRLAAIACAVALGLAGCGSDTEDHGGEDGENTRTAVGTPAPEVSGSAEDEAAPNTADLPSTPGNDGGRRVIVESGCLACHEIGVEGNDGPGPSLTQVGSRLSKDEIRRNLISPSPPMPSYRELPAEDLDDVVAYLAALR